MKYPRGVKENTKQKYSGIVAIYADTCLFNKEVCEKTSVGIVACRESNETIGEHHLIFYSQKRQFP